LVKLEARGIFLSGHGLLSPIYQDFHSCINVTKLTLAIFMDGQEAGLVCLLKGFSLAYQVKAD